MTRSVTGVPGIHSTGTNSTDRCLAILGQHHGFETNDPDLNKRTAIGVYFMLWKDVRQVANALRHKDMVLCHSYGSVRGTLGIIRWQKRNPGRYVKVLALFAPAMEVDFDFDQIDPRTKIICFHSNNDGAVKLGVRMPLHKFGKAGVTGFTHPRVENIDASPNDHNDYFNWDKINAYLNHAVVAFDS